MFIMEIRVIKLISVINMLLILALVKGAIKEKEYALMAQLV